MNLPARHCHDFTTKELGIAPALTIGFSELADRPDSLSGDFGILHGVKRFFKNPATKITDTLPIPLIPSEPACTFSLVPTAT